MKSLGKILRSILSAGSGRSKQASPPSSLEYWEKRYASGKTSGIGSYGKLAEFKAEILNSFVKENNVRSVIEFGCGDGNQLSLAEYPNYIGLDVSKVAIRLCEERFGHDETKRFFLYDPIGFAGNPVLEAELALSLDVIYHLVEDWIFDRYMSHLFSAAEKYVIIYSSHTDDNPPSQGHHIRHRSFSKWIKAHRPDWRLIRKIPNRYPFDASKCTGSLADFYIYENTPPTKSTRAASH